MFQNLGPYTGQLPKRHGFWMLHAMSVSVECPLRWVSGSSNKFRTAEAVGEVIFGLDQTA